MIESNDIIVLKGNVYSEWKKNEYIEYNEEKTYIVCYKPSIVVGFFHLENRFIICTYILS